MGPIMMLKSAVDKDEEMRMRTRAGVDGYDC